ncbi:MAG TPA: SCP2 sterol-binding domain-containing protein [Baekduia sp.]|nr:SCP2 sterol-binding domain-containing protein [Baekduia sp.]
MARFASEQEVYDDLGRLLANAAADGDTSARLKQVDAVVQYRIKDPVATITLDARAKLEATVDLGETNLEPEIVFSLDADTARELLYGELNLTAALAAGDIATKGPVTKVLKYLPVNLSGAPDAAAATETPAPEEPSADTTDVPAGDPDASDETVAGDMASDDDAAPVDQPQEAEASAPDPS